MYVHQAISLCDCKQEAPVSWCELNVSDCLILLEHVLALPLFLILDLNLFPDVYNLVVAGGGNHRAELGVSPLNAKDRGLMASALR